MTGSANNIEVVRRLARNDGCRLSFALDLLPSFMIHESGQPAGTPSALAVIANSTGEGTGGDGAHDRPVFGLSTCKM